MVHFLFVNVDQSLAHSDSCNDLSTKYIPHVQFHLSERLKITKAFNNIEKILFSLMYSSAIIPVKSYRAQFSGNPDPIESENPPEILTRDLLLGHLTQQQIGPIRTNCHEVFQNYSKSSSPKIW